MNFTHSTIGIIQKPKRMEIKYSCIPTEVKPNASAKNGTSHIVVVNINDIKVEIHKNKF